MWRTVPGTPSKSSVYFPNSSSSFHFPFSYSWPHHAECKGCDFQARARAPVQIHAERNVSGRIDIFLFVNSAYAASMNGVLSARFVHTRDLETTRQLLRNLFTASISFSWTVQEIDKILFWHPSGGIKLYLGGRRQTLPNNPHPHRTPITHPIICTVKLTMISIIITLN